MKLRQTNYCVIALTVIIGLWMLVSPAQSVVKRMGGAGNVLIAATGTDITGLADQTYTFAEPVGGAYVQINPNSNDTLYIKWNAAAADTDNWDVILVAGGVEYVELGGDTTGGIIVNTVTIYSATDSVLNEDFVVKGIDIQ